MSFPLATASPLRRLERSPLLAWALMCVLFFAPLAGAMHGVAHGVGARAGSVGATHAHEQGVPLKACDECMAMTQVQPAPAAVHAIPTAADVVGTRFEAIAGGRPTHGPDIFHSRGPPGAA